LLLWLLLLLPYALLLLLLLLPYPLLLLWLSPWHV
jgi:hypothetical protein